MSKKKDEYSWAYRGVKRRDFRHAHDEPEVPRHKGSKKNTKKWCKGKNSIEHTSILRKKTWRNSKGEERVLYRYNECEKCGKHLSYEWNRLL